mmetsp:Transcript_3080/g.8539  ORF Transcript_3080/g.8539 Transcript_3080/m.8539 type:complete len:236 (+) Transcript_3080:245-952(+)
MDTQPVNCSTQTSKKPLGFRAGAWSAPLHEVLRELCAAPGATNCAQVAKATSRAVANHATLACRNVTQSRPRSLPTPEATADRRSLASALKQSFMAALVGVTRTSWLTSVRPKARMAAQAAAPVLPERSDAQRGVAARPAAAAAPKPRIQGRLPCLSESEPTQGCTNRPSNGEKSQQMLRRGVGTWSPNNNGMNRASQQLQPSSGTPTAICAATLCPTEPIAAMLCPSKALRACA